jgi:hypothetical protein
MAEHIEPIDIGDTSELLQLAEEVHRSHRPRLLRRNGEDLALVVPLPQPVEGHQRPRAITAEEYEAFRSAGGSWKGLVDTDKLIEDIYESRRISTRPPVEL